MRTPAPICPVALLAVALLAAAGLACGGLCPAATADDASGARRTILAAYRSMDRAAQSKDARGALAFYAPDYVGISADGKQKTDRASQVRVTEFFIRRAKSLRGSTVIQKFRLSGDRVVAVVRQHQEFVPLVPDAALRRGYTFIWDTTSEDTWERRGQAWLKTQRQVLSYRVRQGGKPFA